MRMLALSLFFLQPHNVLGYDIDRELNISSVLISVIEEGTTRTSNGKLYRVTVCGAHWY
jgi:hypothetical protein